MLKTQIYLLAIYMLLAMPWACTAVAAQIANQGAILLLAFGTSFKDLFSMEKDSCKQFFTVNGTQVETNRKSPGEYPARVELLVKNREKR